MVHRNNTIELCEIRRDAMFNSFALCGKADLEVDSSFIDASHGTFVLGKK